MAEIFNFPTQEEPHTQGDAKCLACGHEWLAVCPAGVTELECPECKTMKGLFIHLTGPPIGVEYRECNCGCSLFRILRQGHMCANCGTFQTYDN